MVSRSPNYDHSNTTRFEYRLLLQINQKIIMYTKILKTETNQDGISFQIDFGDNMVLWFDTHMDEDNHITGDWNKYIFHTTNEQDMKEQAFQNACNDDVGAYNFARALEACEEYIAERLQYLRGEIEKECISYGEIAELATLREYIEPDDVVLLEWAGVPENN